MEFLVSALLIVVLPLCLIIGLFFTSVFKNQIIEPDFIRFNQEDEEEKAKLKKTKAKKNQTKPVKKTEDKVKKVAKEEVKEVKEVKYVEITKKSKKETVSEQKKETIPNSDDWIVMKDKKNKNKLGKKAVIKDVPTIKSMLAVKKNPSQKSVVNKASMVEVKDHTEEKNEEVMVMVERKKKKETVKIVPVKKEEKSLNVVKLSSSLISHEETAKQAKIKKDLENQVLLFNKKMKESELQRMKKSTEKGVMLVVEDGLKGVQEEEKQLAEFVEVVEGKKKKKNKTKKLDAKEEGDIKGDGGVGKVDVIGDKVVETKVKVVKEEMTENGVDEAAKKKKKNKKKKKPNQTEEAQEIAAATIETKAKAVTKASDSKPKPVASQPKATSNQPKSTQPTTKQSTITKPSNASNNNSSTNHISTTTPKPSTQTNKIPLTQDKPQVNGVSKDDSTEWQEAKQVKKKKKVVKAQ